jgi:tRNA(fMet)-specific endonuclease VapC
MPYLLDTNIVSDLTRNPFGRAAVRAQSVGEQHIFVSLVVAAELRFGLARKPSPLLSGRIEALLSQFQVLPLEAPLDQIYADLRARLESRGTPIGANDLFIAAHALALGYTLVTDNEREFSRVPELVIENWLR